MPFSAPLRWPFLLMGLGAQDLSYLVQASDVSRSELPEIDRHYDAVFSCGNPHVPFSSDVNEGNNNRQHLEPPRVHLEAPSCLVLSARQPATLHKQLGINAMDRSLLLFPYFLFRCNTTLRQCSVCHRPALPHRFQAGPPVNHVSESSRQRRHGCTPSRGGVPDAIWPSQCVAQVSP